MLSQLHEICVCELKLKIIVAIETITQQMLENTWREIEYCLDILRAMKECACWSRLSFYSIDCIINKTYLVIFSYSISSFILLFPVWKL
jgi:hypothetical protein